MKESFEITTGESQKMLVGRNNGVVGLTRL